MIWALAISIAVHIMHSYVHASTVRMEGQLLCFWISLNIIGRVAFEKFVIGALLGKLQGLARSTRALVSYVTHNHSKVRRSNLLVLNQC